MNTQLLRAKAWVALFCLGAMLQAKPSYGASAKAASIAMLSIPTPTSKATPKPTPQATPTPTSKATSKATPEQPLTYKELERIQKERAEKMRRSGFGGYDYWEITNKANLPRTEDNTRLEPTLARMCNKPENRRLEGCKIVRLSQEIAMENRFWETRIEAVKNGKIVDASGVRNVCEGLSFVSARCLARVIALGHTFLDQPSIDLDVKTMQKPNEKLKILSTVAIAHYQVGGLNREVVCKNMGGQYTLIYTGNKGMASEGKCTGKNNQKINLGIYDDIHTKLCQRAFGEKGKPSIGIIEGNKIFCNVNGERKELRGISITQVTDCINKNPSDGNRNKQTDTCSTNLASAIQPDKPAGQQPTAQRDRQAGQQPTDPTQQPQQQTLTDQVAQISQQVAQSSQGDINNPQANIENIRRTKHRLILEAIKQQQESNKKMAENFSKIMEAKANDVKRDAEIHQELHQILMQKLEYDQADTQENIALKNQYLRELQRRNYRLQNLIKSERLKTLKGLQTQVNR